MGVKGAKKTSRAVEEHEAMKKLLDPLGDITTRSQFGGYGVFEGGKMFALITSDGVLHLKVDDSNRDDFPPEAQFGKMPYCAVPKEVRSNTRSLRSWARKSIAIAHGAAS